MASASGTLTIRMSGMGSSAALTMQAALTRTAASAIARLVSIEIGFMSLVESTVECRLDQAQQRSPETPGDCNIRPNHVLSVLDSNAWKILPCAQRRGERLPPTRTGPREGRVRVLCF